MGITTEQDNYIKYSGGDTKLIATAGSGKTFTIIHKIKHLIENGFNSDEILVLTFSRFTRDDFINRIKKYKFESIINEKTIKTIDSFAKEIIDKNNDVDVSILSYKLMKYLEKCKNKDLDEKIKKIKMIFIDEAQDLNETQYKILSLIKKKNKTFINLIGDPNQNIYQFRSSSTKYLMEHQGEVFYLTNNFRSHHEMVEFSKYLRPHMDVDIVSNKPKLKCLPILTTYLNDFELEKNIIDLINSAVSNKINLSSFAILAPTRGNIYSNGRSNGLCLVSNILYKHGIKFKQFYDESHDDASNPIEYKPVDNHVNLLTFMGSKGLEWDYTILIDVDNCLINKKNYTADKHKNDQYLLYVACSRAIKNLFIYSKYSIIQQTEYITHTNNWLNLVPSDKYVKNVNREFKFPDFKEKITDMEENNIWKIINQCSEDAIYNLATICGYGLEKTNVKKSETQLYKLKDPVNTTSFGGKFFKLLFFVYYNIYQNNKRIKFNEIDNILKLNIFGDKLSNNFLNWYKKNKFGLSWKFYDENKHTFDQEIIDTIENNFNRNIDLEEYIVIPDMYFNNFILSNSDKIKSNYEKYLNTNDMKKISKYVFNICVVMYALETKHYYHISDNGEYFKDIYDGNKKLIRNIEKVCKNNNLDINFENIKINKNDLMGYFDFSNNQNELFIVKYTSDITLKHILYHLISSLLYYGYENKKTIDIKTNFINLFNGKLISLEFHLTQLKIKNIFDIINKHKKQIIL